MHRNALWLSFLAFVIIITAWFLFKGGYAFYNYSRYTEQAPITVKKAEIKEVKSKFLIVLHYAFTYENALYQGNNTYGKPYLNAWSAEKAWSYFADQPLFAWVDPRHPERSILEKTFPWKPILSACALLGLTIYFFCLGFYVKANLT